MMVGLGLDAGCTSLSCLMILLALSGLAWTPSIVLDSNVCSVLSDSRVSQRLAAQ